MVVQPYTSQFISLYAYFPPFPSTGPRHLYFTVPNDAYVLPNGMNLAQKQPPSIASISPQADGTVIVAGASLTAESKVYFDSLSAVTRSFTGNESAGALLVVPPPGFNGQVAAVRGSNSDGQSSTFLQPTPPTFTYGASGAPGLQFNASSNALPQGTSAMIDVTGVNTQFIDGLTTIAGDERYQRPRVCSGAQPDAFVGQCRGFGQCRTGRISRDSIHGLPDPDQGFGFQVVPASGRPSFTLPPVNVSPTQTSIATGSFVS